MLAPDVGRILTRWARGRRDISGLVLIGSRERRSDDPVWRADRHSDWDFQVITSRPEVFATAAWTRGLRGLRVEACGVRTARIGGVPKIHLLAGGTEVDLVIIPSQQLQSLAAACRRGEHLRTSPVRSALQDLAMVIRPGWRFLHGSRRWAALFRRVVAEVPDPRLDDAAIRNLALCFRSDHRWLERKLARGELVAAQRMLHLGLAETNLRLLHELRQRRGRRSFPEGRRLERIAGRTELAALTVSARPSRASLQAAARKAAATCAWLERELTGLSPTGKARR
jgi:hypothetical protein